MITVIARNTTAMIEFLTAHNLSYSQDKTTFHVEKGWDWLICMLRGWGFVTQDYPHKNRIVCVALIRDKA